MLLGAGRKTKEDTIDHSAGITMMKKIGDKVAEGDTLCILHTNIDEYNEAYNMANEAFDIGNAKPDPVKFIHDIIKWFSWLKEIIRIKHNSK